MFRFTIRDVLWLMVVVAVANGWLLAGASVSAQEDRPDPSDIMAKVYEKYGKLRSYHLEHTIRFEESDAKNKPALVAEVTLVTISERRDGVRLTGEIDNWSDARKRKQFPMNLSRFHFAAKRKGADIVLACDGESSWLFHGQTKEFKRAKDAVALGPTAGTMFTALHLAPLWRFVDDSLQVERSPKEQAIEVGGVRKPCYVLEGIAKSFPPPETPSIEQTLLPEGYNPVAMPTGIHMLLNTHGFATAPDHVMYVPAAGKAMPATFTLWVDKRDSTVWQSRMVEKVRKPSAKEGQDSDDENVVTLQMTDTFSIAKLDSAIDPGLFRFTPPSEAKEVQEFSKSPLPSKEA